jgi:endonuclease/exonuclease/phosphatase family metal-dependent hydrolase
MRRALRVFGAGIGILLVGGVLFVLWASSGRLAEEDLAQVRTYAPAPDTTAPDTLTVTTYNIGYLSGMTNNEPVVRPDSLFGANMDQAVRFLREARPDIVGLQEIDFGGARVGHVHQLDTLATRLGYPAAAQAVNWDERYLPFPYGRPAVHFGRTLSGQAVLSRLPIQRHTRNVLPRPPQPFYRAIFYLDRLAQVAVVDIGGRPLALINVHLEAFHVGTREEQARIVNALHRRLDRAGIPTLLLGDFNSSLEADTSRRSGQSAAADTTMRSLLEDTDLRPAVAAMPGDTARATYPADAPTHRIDYIFYSPRFFEAASTRRWCGAPVPPSDHCAVTTHLVPEPPGGEWPSHEAVPSLTVQPSE